MNYWQKICKLMVAVVLTAAIMAPLTPSMIAGRTAAATATASRISSTNSESAAANNFSNTPTAASAPLPNAPGTVAPSPQAPVSTAEAAETETTTNDGTTSAGDETIAADNDNQASTAPTVDENDTGEPDDAAGEEAAEEDGADDQVEPAEPADPDAPLDADSDEAVDDDQVAADEEAQNREEGGVMPDVEPDAPTIADDGVHAASKKGMIFVIPIRAGFVSQPQAEQYVAEGNEVNLDTQLTELNILSGSETVTVKQWLYTEDGWASKDLETTYKASSGFLSNRYAAKIRLGPDTNDTLPLGYYYFQLRFKRGAIFTSNYYSNLVKVVVQSDETAATGLSITPESNVVMAGMDYDVKATVTPNNSTSVVTWPDSDQVDYNPGVGRTVDFQVPTSLTNGQVNKSTENPGLPVTLSATANNLNASATVYAGGLRAQSLPLDVAQKYGFSWTVAGLDKIHNEFYDSGDDDEDSKFPITKTAYKWTYYKKDNKGNYASTNFPSDVSNSSGSFDVPDDINTSQLLTVPATSGLITDAYAATQAGDSFYAQLTLSITLKISGGLIPKYQTVDVTTNLAQFEITGAVGELSLEKVPNFNFGSLTAKQIYQGTTNNGSTAPTSTNTADNLLTITDTRPNDQHWSLTAKMSTFTDQDGQALNGATLRFDGLAGKQPPQIDDSQAWYELLNSDSHNSGEFALTASLLMAANPAASLQQDKGFHASLTWNLTTDSPVAPAL